MHILLANTGTIPVSLYGGTERVIWCLGKELVRLGHQVTYLVEQGSSCPFASVVFLDTSKGIAGQIPDNVDIAHFHFVPPDLEELTKPYVVTMHGNRNDQAALDRNTIFISRNHAKRFGSEVFVHNGLDWDEYMRPDFSTTKRYFHFLGKAAWRVKNVQGAIDVIKRTKRERLKVLGGVRFNFNMGLRLTFSPRVAFYGMVGGREKFQLLNDSKGLIFPIRWHEPFGLAIIESLYFGCPVFGTPYGSLPEIVTDAVGHLSNKGAVLAEAIGHSETYSRSVCHEYARDLFSAKKMAAGYVERYERVLSGAFLNTVKPRLQAVQHEKFLPWTP